MSMQDYWLAGYVQDTHRYNPDYAYLDDGHELAWRWRVVGSHDIEPVDYDDGGGYDLRVEVDGEHTEEEVSAVMGDHFRKGCSCMHDCCGHLFGGTRRVKRVRHHQGRYIYRVKVGYGRNY